MPEKRRTQTLPLELPLLPEPYPAPENGKSPSYAWCFALWDALRVLTRFKVADGSEAVSGVVRSSPEYCTDLIVADFSDNELVAPYDDDRLGWWVCDLYLSTTEDDSPEAVNFYSADFRGNGDGARAKFARVIEHLCRHAIPQIPPAWLDRALAALQGIEEKRA